MIWRIMIWQTHDLVDREHADHDLADHPVQAARLAGLVQ
jgi:hypothetical protein